MSSNLMNKALGAVTLAAAVGMPAVSGAATILKTDTLTLGLYGKIRMSADYANADADSNDDGFSVSSNSSLFGIKGSVPLNPGYRALFQIEQTVLMDVGNGNLATRNTYVGVGTPYGRALMGHMDTPFKTMGLKFTNYTVTASDPHVILGAASTDSSPRLDLRGKNAIEYINSFGHTASVRLMYSAGAQDKQVGIDDDHTKMYSAMATYNVLPKLQLGAAGVRYSNLTPGADVNAWRVGARYAFNKFAFKAILEDINASDLPALSRAAFGGSVEYAILPKTKIGVQWMHANESDAQNDAANQYSLTLRHSFNSAFLAYATVSTTRNENSASYQLTGYGHGQKVSTVDGGNPAVASVGAQLKF